jgi:hypothetical protein
LVPVIPVIPGPSSSAGDTRPTDFKECSLDDAVFVDFETYMTKDYSLKKMSTRAYVGDARFDVLCLSIAQGANGPVDFYHKFDPGTRTLLVARERLAQAGAEGMRLVCHNASFEALILKLKWGIEFAHIFDTAGYLRYLGLGASLKNGAMFYSLAKADAPPFTEESLRDLATLRQMARYNATDVALCRYIFNKALEDKHFGKLETWILDQTCQGNVRGIRIDSQWAKRAATVFNQHRDEAIKALCQEFPDFNMDIIRRQKLVLKYANGKFGVALTVLDRKAPEVIEMKRTHNPGGSPQKSA